MAWGGIEEYDAFMYSKMYLKETHNCGAIMILNNENYPLLLSPTTWLSVY